MDEQVWAMAMDQGRLLVATEKRFVQRREDAHSGLLVVRLKRPNGADVLRCPRCERRMRVLATISDSDVVRQILDHLGVRSSLPCAPPRDSSWEQADLGFEAA
jgi:hypothetical protein